MERTTLRNSTALQAVAGFTIGAALVGVAAWWFQSPKDPSKASKEVYMAPIPDKPEEGSSETSASPSGAVEHASSVGNLQADNQSSVLASDSNTTGDLQGAQAPCVASALDEDIVLAEAIADSPTISWRQTEDEVVLETPVGEDVHSKNLVCTINARSLYLAVLGKVMVDEPLFASISPDESSWEIGDTEEGRKITVSLHKANLPASQCNWKTIFAGRDPVSLESQAEE